MKIPRKSRRVLPDFVPPDGDVTPILSPASLSTLDCSCHKSSEIPGFSKLKALLCMPRLAHMLFAKATGLGLASKMAARSGAVGFLLRGGVTTLPLAEKPTKLALRPQRRDTGPFCTWAVPQGTQKLGGGFPRHLRHLWQWLGVSHLYQPLTVAAVTAESQP